MAFASENEDRPSNIGRRVLGFGSLPIVSLVASLLILPILARVAGEAGWVAVAIGHSAGAFGSIVIMYGWGLLGPTRISRASPHERPAIYAESIVSRLTISVAVIPLVALSASLLSPSPFKMDAVLMSIAISLGGLSPMWYAIGAGKPRSAAYFDTLPRIAATGCSALLLIVTSDVTVYPVVLLITAVATAVTFSIKTISLRHIANCRPQATFLRLWQTRSAALTELAAGSYAALPVVLVSAVSPTAAAAIFVSAERLYRIGLLMVSALSNAFQGWVSEDRDAVAVRMRISLLTHSLIGIVGMLLFTTLAPPVSSLLFGKELATDAASALWLGVAFFGVSVNTSLGRHMLVPLGMTRALLVSTAAGACVGVPLILMGAITEGSAGGAFGLAASQLVVCIIQGVALLNRAASTRGR